MNTCTIDEVCDDMGWDLESIKKSYYEPIIQKKKKKEIEK